VTQEPRKLQQQTKQSQSETAGGSPGPDSILWQTFSDLTIMPFSIAILVMQAAHPDIGAAVAKYSIYKDEPWGRMFRTGYSLARFIHGGKNGRLGLEEAKNLRTLHANIRGTHRDGSTYHSLHPCSYRVVPDTFLDGVLRFRETVGEPLDADEKRQVFEEYLNLCLLFGIRREQLQSSLEDFVDYFEDLMLNTMTYNDSVAFLLGDMLKYGPKMKYVPLPQSWCEAIYHRTLYPMLRLFALGFLDPRFRQQHNIEWSEKDQRNNLRWLGVVHFFRRWVPRWLRYSPFALHIMWGGRGMKLVTIEHLEKNLKK
jgi:uncharacterized protein (DUF2236 family)